MTDREKFLAQAKTYIGKDGNYVCNTRLHLGGIYDWCAYSVSAIMMDCEFIGKYIREIEGGAGDIPRYSDGKYGRWFRASAEAPQPGDLFFLRYGGRQYSDKYHADHIGIVAAVNGAAYTTLEGNVDGKNGNWAATSVFRSKTRHTTDGITYAFYRPSWQGEKKQLKALTEIAKEVIQGKWGAGADRERRLTDAGYDYRQVQQRVNELMKPKKDNTTIAREVIQGKWGSGEDRKKRLTAAGYDYNAVQTIVNRLMKK